MRKSVWIVLAIVALVTAGCGPAMAPATTAQTDSGEVFMIALPRIVINFDTAGVPSVMNVKLSDLAKYGFAVPNYQLDPNMVREMTARNIQHIEMRQTGTGLVAFINGKAMPYLAWSDQSLQKLTDLSGLIGPQNDQTLSIIRRFLPIVRRLGLDVVVTFPAAAGAQPIPMVNPDEAVKIAAAPSTVPPSAVVQFEVKYDERGVPGILGVTASDLAAMGLSAPLALDPSYLQMLQNTNIQNIEIRNKGDGLFLYVNGEQLPGIVWDDQLLNNAADAWISANPGAPADLVAVVKAVVPNINKGDIAVLVHFPAGSGKQPIAAKMQ